MHRIIRYLAGFLGILGAMSALAQSPTPIPVTGNLGSISGLSQPYAGVQIQLQNCPSPVLITGYMGIVQQTYQIQASSGGLINSTIWPNNLITCNGTTGNSQYSVMNMVSGVPSGSVQCYQTTSTQGIWNLNTQQPIACSQTPPAPGDVTYHNVNINGCLSISGGPCGGGGGGSGSILSGAQNSIPYYVTSPTGTTLGASNIKVDSTGNSLSIPTSAIIGPAIVGNKVSIGPLSTVPADWTLDDTTPATALASLGGFPNTSILSVAKGGTGTATPTPIAGANMTITGTWPNQTFSSIATGSGIAKVIVALPSGTPILAGLCSAVFTASMPGVVAPVGSIPGSTFTYSFVGDVSGVVGYGGSGGLNLVPWPTTDHFNGKMCNPTAVNITPGAASMNVGAQ